MTFGFGVPILVIGLTAPQIGTRLHVESQPLAVPLMKIWAVALVGVVALFIIDGLFPWLRYELGFPRARYRNFW